MCGILGWIGFGSRSPSLRLDLLRHRGPDDEGEAAYHSRSARVAAVLGSTRLSIIDLSRAGHMPMEYAGEPISIVYNGEVYNFADLRSELEAKGERFFSRTDTEVVLRGYRVWGDAVVDRLRGMFAFAIWDGREDGRLLLARDRFGKKPLYVRQDGDKGLWFSSELKALLSPDAPREVDPISLQYYLERGYPPPDRCLLRGWGKVQPGHFVVWEDGQARDRKYWSPCEASEATKDISPAEAAGELRVRLEEAVRIRLVADVPLGLLLSGGLDSSTILSAMARQHRQVLRTYTACFGPRSLDESEEARSTALLFGTEHRAIMINPRSGRLLPFIASQMDEPIADPSAIATYLICRRARQEVKVLLSGDGSDELLLGYPRYRLHAAATLAARFMPLALRRGVSRLLPRWSIPDRAFSAPEDPLVRDRYWLSHARSRDNAFKRAARSFSIEEAVRTVLREDIATWLVEDILIKLDKMSMASSVECRAPFLDPKLSEWVMGLPVWVRMSWRQGKVALRRAMQGSLPAHTQSRPKQPFFLPIDEWLSSEWRTLVQDVLLDTRTRQRGWVAEDHVSRILKEQLAGEASHGRRIYQLLVLELWARSILDRGEPVSPPTNVDDCSRELPSDRPVRKVAVIAPAGIGDTMRLTPAIRHLGASDPSVSVTVYVDRQRGSDEVMAGQAPVDRHVQIGFSDRGLRKLLALVSDVRRNSPDEVVSAWVSTLAGWGGLLSGVKNRTGWVPQWSAFMRLFGSLWRHGVPYDPVQKDVGRNDSLAFNKVMGFPSLHSVGPSFSAPIWEERALIEAKRQLGGLKRPILAVSPAAAATIRQREYPLRSMCKVVADLLANAVVHSIVLLGDGHAKPRLAPLAQIIGSRGMDCSGELSLAATAALLRECDAALVVDGGLLHIALTSDLPVVALYGPTEIYSSDPREGDGRYIALSAYDKCRCNCLSHRGISPVPECAQEAHCLSTIPPERVLDAVAAVLRPAHGARDLERLAAPASEGTTS